jgi:hypothetical protein
VSPVKNGVSSKSFILLASPTMILLNTFWRQ